MIIRYDVIIFLFPLLYNTTADKKENKLYVIIYQIITLKLYREEKLIISTSLLLPKLQYLS